MVEQKIIIIGIIVIVIIIISIVLLLRKKTSENMDTQLNSHSLLIQLSTYQTQIQSAINTNNKTQLKTVTNQFKNFAQTNKNNIITAGSKLGWNNSKLQPMYNITDIYIYIYNILIQLSNQILKGGYPPEIPGFLNGQLGQTIFEITNPCPNPLPEKFKNINYFEYRK